MRRKKATTEPELQPEIPVEPPVKPSVFTPIPTDLQDFQRAYGHQWLKTVQSPEFKAAMQLLNIRKLDGLTGLTNEQIEKNGREILSNLVGHLQHENDLFTLHTKEEFTIPYEEPDEYASPDQQAKLAMDIEKFNQSQQPK